MGTATDDYIGIFNDSGVKEACALFNCDERTVQRLLAEPAVLPARKLYHRCLPVASLTHLSDHELALRWLLDDFFMLDGREACCAEAVHRRRSNLKALSSSWLNELDEVKHQHMLAWESRLEADVEADGCFYLADAQAYCWGAAVPQVRSNIVHRVMAQFQSTKPQPQAVIVKHPFADRRSPCRVCEVWSTGVHKERHWQPRPIGHTHHARCNNWGAHLHYHVATQARSRL
jgi:hypothetical protein